jgi:glycolate oxidase
MAQKNLMSTAVNAPLIDELVRQLGAERVLTAPEDVAVYAYDGTPVLRQNPACVVFPKTTAEVAACVQAATRAAAPIVTRGSGTGLSGGSVPAAGCVVLCLTHMNRILELDTRNLTIEVEAGVVTQAIDEAAAKHGLFYPPDPGSRKISTIGGNVAENSGGLRGLKYGVTRDYVLGLEAVLASGDVVWLGNNGVAGKQVREGRCGLQSPRFVHRVGGDPWRRHSRATQAAAAAGGPQDDARVVHVD